MKTESRIRALTTRLIQLLVLFEILWAVVFVVGLTFKWSGLTDQLTEAFFGAGFCSLVLVGALAALNVVTNLNIMSQSLEGRVVDSPAAVEKRVNYWPLLVGAAALIAIVVGALGIAEARLYRTKRIEAETKLESIADTSLVTNAIRLVAEDGHVKDLREIRDAIAAAIQSGNRVSLLIPKETQGVKAYYEFSGWWTGGADDVKIGALALPRFAPAQMKRTISTPCSPARSTTSASRQVLT